MFDRCNLEEVQHVKRINTHMYTYMYIYIYIYVGVHIQYTYVAVEVPAYIQKKHVFPQQDTIKLEPRHTPVTT